MQLEQLFDLIKKAQNTNIGKYYDYKSIKTVKDYQDRVPVQNYDQMELVITSYSIHYTKLYERRFIDIRVPIPIEVDNRSLSVAFMLVLSLNA